MILAYHFLSVTSTLTLEYTFCIILLDAEVTETEYVQVIVVDDSLTLMERAVAANRLFHFYLDVDEQDEADWYSQRKISLACQATLLDPRRIDWRVDANCGGSISISVHGIRYLRIHIPRNLLHEHISTNGFEPAERSQLLTKLEETRRLPRIFSRAKPAPTPKKRKGRKGKRPRR